MYDRRSHHYKCLTRKIVSDYHKQMVCCIEYHQEHEVVKESGLNAPTDAKQIHPFSYKANCNELEKAFIFLASGRTAGRD